jgi:hypothetical protein
MSVKWPEPQLTREEAISFADQRIWEDMTPMQRGAFQLRQELLAMPFDKFHEGVEELLGRQVWTHEFGLNLEGLQAEAAGLADAPTMEEIIALIPPDKLIISKF